MTVGYYVSLRRDSRTALLLGPYASHEAALSRADEGRTRAEAVDPWAAFDAVGTLRIERAFGELPCSRFWCLE